MILSIHDFPLRYEDNYIKNSKGEVILNLSKKLKRERVIQFIIESLPAINDGKRVFKKRLTKTFYNKSLDESINIIKKEMFEKGFVFNENFDGINDVEYNIITKEGNKKINFNKISSMDKKDIIKNLESVLIRIIDAKDKSNLTEQNKEIALKDLIQLLNIHWESAKNNVVKGSLNKYQEIWYSAIISANKKIKYPLVSITSGLFRCYIITLFGSIGEENVLKQLTGWNTQMLEKEKFTYDMKVLFLSINKMIQNKEEKIEKEESNEEGLEKKED